MNAFIVKLRKESRIAESERNEEGVTNFPIMLIFQMSLPDFSCLLIHSFEFSFIHSH